MKIAHIGAPGGARGPRDDGGTENVLFDLIEEQVALGHDVTLFAPGDARTSARLVSCIPRSLRAEEVPWSAYLKAEYHLQQSLLAAKAMDVEIVHTHLSSSSDLCLFSLLSELTIPHVTTLHSHFPFDRVLDWQGDADRFYLHSWGGSVPIVTISQHARDEVPPGVLVVGVVYNGLCLRRYVPAPVDTSDTYLVWLGHFVPDKGAHHAIEVAKRTHISLVLAGTIDYTIPKAVRYFKEYIEPHLDQQQIRYIGPVNNTRKITLLSGARCLLNPITWEEPFGMVMIEAMALSCPVISFARGAAPELVVHGKTGFLVQDIDKMVQAIPQLTQIDRQAIRSHVEYNFSARVMANNYIKVYQHLLRRRCYG